MFKQLGMSVPDMSCLKCGVNQGPLPVWCVSGVDSHFLVSVVALLSCWQSLIHCDRYWEKKRFRKKGFFITKFTSVLTGTFFLSCPKQRAHLIELGLCLYFDINTGLLNTCWGFNISSHPNKQKFILEKVMLFLLPMSNEQKTPCRSWLHVRQWRQCSFSSLSL